MSTSEIAKLESRWRENPNGLTFAPLAEAYRKLKDPQRALEILVLGLEKHPDYIPANIVLGRCHWDLDDLPAAERAFTHVLGLDGENVIALKALADITERLVRYDEAERWLETLLAVDRSNDEARAQLERIRELQRQQAEGGAVVPEASEAAAEAIAVAPPVEMVEPEAPMIEEPLAPPEAFEPAPEPPGLEEVSSVEYIGWVARPDDTASVVDPLPLEELGSGAALETPVAAPVEPVEEPPAESAPAVAPSEPPFARPPFPDIAGFGIEQSEEIVLNVSGQTEYQVPSAVDDLMAGMKGTPRAGVDDLRRDLAPAEPITSALSAYDTPVPEPVAEPQMEQAEPADTEPPPPAPAIEAAAELDDAPAVAEPELVVTETMAEVFLRQGHFAEALTVYRELVRRSPGEQQLAGRVAELEARQAAAAAPPPRRAYAAHETGGQSVAAFFQTLLAARPDELPSRWPGQSDAAAPAEPPPESASATRPAVEPLSLGSVFGDEPPPVAPAVRASGETAAPGGATPVSFDDFFDSSSRTTGSTPPPTPGRPQGRSGDDLDQFHAWLQSLKR